MFQKCKKKRNSPLKENILEGLISESTEININDWHQQHSMRFDVIALKLSFCSTLRFWCSD